MPRTQWAPPQGHAAGSNPACLPPGPMTSTLPYDRAHLLSGHLGMSFGFQQFRVPGPCGLPRAALYAQATNCLLRCPEITLLFRPAPSRLPPTRPRIAACITLQNRLQDAASPLIIAQPCLSAGIAGATTPGTASVRLRYAVPSRRDVT